MLTNYNGKVTVKIDGIAASAASVIAMAGDKVLVSPVSMIMIHNPATIAWGDHSEMQKAIDMLSEVKESIINAYVLKTGLSRSKLSHLMDSETWMDANKAIELGFADDIMTRTQKESEDEKLMSTQASMLYSRNAMQSVLLNKIEKHYKKPAASVCEQIQIPANTGRSVDEIMERLNFMKKFI